jgi:hypothetical protein
MQLRSVRFLIAAAAAFVTMTNLPRSANAQESVEGTTVGDMGFYWYFPQESWIFPHRIGNIDNRATLQWNGGSGQYLTISDLIGGSALSGKFYNVLPEQLEDGGGAVLSLGDNVNVGIWFADYDGPGINTFLTNGVNAMGWDHANSTTVNELQGVDQFDGNMDAGRKVDFFFGYAMPDSGLEAGIRFWWGSDNQSLLLDDSDGFISIDEPSDPANTPSAWDNQDVQESFYGVREWGFALGGGYSGIDNVRIDAGLQLNMIGVSWEPNAITDYVDAGGTGVGINLRGHYDMGDGLSLGAFVRFARDSYSMEPKRQRDGGELDEFDDTENPGLPDPPGAPPSGDPTNTNGEDLPVAGIKYEETRSELQVAGLIKYTPMSRVILYGAIGVARLGASQTTSLDTDWLSEDAVAMWATPFINLGFTGKITDNLDIFMGASRRMQQWTHTEHHLDTRIPDDGNSGASGAPPASPDDNNTNETRRDITREDSHDESPLELSVGGRFMIGGFQWVMSVSENLFFNGPYFITGASGSAPVLWFSLNYDWDWDTDKASGNGTIVKDGKAAPKAAGGDQVFDS